MSDVLPHAAQGLLCPSCGAENLGTRFCESCSAPAPTPSGPAAAEMIVLPPVEEATTRAPRRTASATATSTGLAPPPPPPPSGAVATAPPALTLDTLGLPIAAIGLIASQTLPGIVSTIMSAAANYSWGIPVTVLTIALAVV